MGEVQSRVLLSIKIFSWNCKGLGRRKKRGKIRKVVFERKIDIVLLQETKSQSLSQVKVKSLWPRDKMEYMCVDSVGSVGGLLCKWDPELFHLLDCCSNRNFILLSGIFLNSFEGVLVNVYALNEVGCRSKLREVVYSLKSLFPKPWCLGGDFNEIRNVGEMRGFSRRDRRMRDFNCFIDNREFSDIPLFGRKFTWCNAGEGGKWSRLNRFLANPKWLEVFNFKLWGLPRLLSDHCSLLLMEDD